MSRENKGAQRKSVYGRKIMIFDNEYRWGMCHSEIRVIDPDQKSHYLKIPQYNHKGEFSVTPKHVAELIKRNLLGFDDHTGFPRGVVPQGWRFTLPDDYLPFDGPRGQWGVKMDVGLTYLVSPEGMPYRYKSDDLFSKETNEGHMAKAHEIIGLRKENGDPPWVLHEQRLIEWLGNDNPFKPNFKELRASVREMFGEKV
jgi:hypothetical protein